jgi:hypothetical protein
MAKHNYRLLTIQLDSIRPHAGYDIYKELLAVINYTIGNSVISEHAIYNCIIMHPVIVVKGRNDIYHCVAGLRTLNMAKSRLPMTTDIEVICLQHIQQDNIEIMISSDVMLTHLLYCIRCPRTLGDIFSHTPKTHIGRILSHKIITRSLFAKQTGYSYNSLFGKK